MGVFSLFLMQGRFFVTVVTEDPEGFILLDDVLGLQPPDETLLITEQLLCALHTPVDGVRRLD